MVPKIEICGHEVSRLIVGGNTISGTSHFSKSLDGEMEDYFTTDNIKKMLYQCMENGINTMQFRGDKHIMRIIREFRKEGGEMQWVAQSTPELASFKGNVDNMNKYNPIMMYHHGVDADNLFKAGKFEELKSRLDYVKSLGIPVGLGTHMPEVIEYSEMHKWDVDFYMACVYNISDEKKVKLSQEQGTEDALFDEKDIPIMYEALRSVKQPCLAFKILGAMRKCQSQETVQTAFNEAFANLKSNDAVVVGMFPRDIDQVRLNSQYVEQAIKNAKK